jgi:hypothetical protein
MNFKLTKSSLNFKVYTSPTIPSSGAENDIVIISTTPMENWILSPDVPVGEPRNAGDVWIQYSVSGNVFDIMNQHDFMLAITRIYQYINGVWMSVNARRYVGGIWNVVSSAFSATINITYPANSTCVVTNSSGQTVASDSNTTSSVKTWTATVNATGTYTVTVTATDGSGESESQSVSIVSDGQSVSVELRYRLPEEYQEVEYIQGNGTSYIDTGLYFTGNTSKLEVVFNYLGNKSYIFGASNGPVFYRGTNNAYLGWFVGDGYVPSLTTGRNEFSLDKNEVYRDGSLVHTFTASSNKSSNTITLYRKNGSTSDTGNIQIAEFRFYENNELVMELIPCYRLSDSVAGFWDRVGERFLTNAGSGTFAVGDNV